MPRMPKYLKREWAFFLFQTQSWKSSRQATLRRRKFAGYGMINFIFTNRFGTPHNPATVNRAIKRIVDAHNAERGSEEGTCGRSSEGNDSYLLLCGGNCGEDEFISE